MPLYIKLNSRYSRKCRHSKSYEYEKYPIIFVFLRCRYRQRRRTALIRSEHLIHQKLLLTGRSQRFHISFSIAGAAFFLLTGRDLIHIFLHPLHVIICRHHHVIYLIHKIHKLSVPVIYPLYDLLHKILYSHSDIRSLSRHIHVSETLLCIRVKYLVGFYQKIVRLKHVFSRLHYRTAQRSHESNSLLHRHYPPVRYIVQALHAIYFAVYEHISVDGPEFRLYYSLDKIIVQHVRLIGIYGCCTDLHHKKSVNSLYLAITYHIPATS